MLRYALRRILWAIPTLFGISLVVFFLTTLLPEPAVVSVSNETSPAVLHAHDEQRRARFLDLPRFVNASPADVRSRADAQIAHLVADDAERDVAAFELARLGGAAVPHVIKRLEGLRADARGRVALALTPIAERMGLGTPETLDTQEKAVLFWTRFWEDRALDFTAPAVDRAVVRLVEHGSDLREKDLIEVDTYALGAVIAKMPDADPAALARLTRIAAHASERGTALTEHASAADARRAIADWQEWWYVHQTDFVELDGVDRVAATLGETRYGKWVMRAASGRLGISSRDGEPIKDKLVAHAPFTLVITLVAMLASYALAVPLGAFAAWRRGRSVDVALTFVLFALYSLPTFWIAQALRGSLAPSGAFEGYKIALPIVALSLGSLAILTRYQRAAMLEVLGQDYVRTARAKGVSTTRELVVHALRNALLPTVTLAGLQLPALLGGAFVVEEVFALPGLGYETLRAVRAHDAPWLMAIVVIAAIVTTVGLVASDVAYGLLDPRVREAIARGHGGTG